MEKQLIIGKGRWAEKVAGILQEKFHIEVDNITREYNTINLYDYDKIYIIITPQHNLEVLNYCLNNSKADIYIEKPLSLSSNNLPDILKTNNKRVFVGNKFIYSPTIQDFKDVLKSEQITGIFTKWIKSIPCHQSGIFFDILYHHLGILEYLFDSKIDITYKKYFTGNTSGVIIGKVKDIPFVMEGSSNNLFRLFSNSIRIETENTTYVIEEKSNIISLSTNDGEVSDNAETIFYCLNEFLSGNFKDVEDLNIIEQLEK